MRAKTIAAMIIIIMKQVRKMLVTLDFTGVIIGFVCESLKPTVV
jgi:hypothetical protein